MNLGTHNWLMSIIISLLLMTAILILGRYFVKNKYTHISDLKNLAKYPDKYKLYLLLLSVLVPGVEILFNLFALREESQFIPKLFVGFAFLGAYIASNYITILARNLHRLAVGAYLVFTLYDYYILASNPKDMIAFTELAGILVFSYYIFYNITHFFVYTFSCFLLLMGFYLYGRIDSSILVILDAIMVISLGLNYAKYIVERNVIANLFNAYNIVNKGNLLVVGINSDGIVEYISDNIQTILGCNRSIVMGRKWAEELENVTGFQIENIELQNQKNHIQKFSCKNGTHKLIEWQEDATNNGLTIKIGRDVTESKLVQEKLAASNHQLKLLEQLINNSTDSFLIAHEDGRIFYLNQTGAERLGVKAEDAQLYRVQDIEPAFIHNEAAWLEHVAQLKKEKQITLEGTNINLITQKPHPVEVNVGYTQIDGQGFVNATIRDISERKKIQSELEQLSLVAQKITNGVLISDMEGHVLWANEAYLNMMEVRMEVLLNKRPRDLFLKVGEDNGFLEKIAQLNGNSYTLDFECITYSKKKIWIEISNTVIKDEEGNPIQQIEIVTDITERKKTEAELLELSILQQGLLDNVPGYIGCKDYNGRFVFVNKSLAELFGKEASEVVGLTDSDYGASKEEAESYLKADREVIDSGKTLFIAEETVLKKDGTRGLFQTVKVPVEISQHKKGFVLIVATDITERKQQELASQERQKTLELRNKLLSKITTIPFEQYGTLKLAFQALTEAASNGLNVNRASFWECKENAIICRDLYINDKHFHEEGIEIMANDFPAYFRGLRSGLAIIAEDAHTHPATFEFSEVYLSPLGISSMLDVSVRINGELIGVLCLEHTADKRNWTNDDVSFARAIADIISLVIEADRRKKAEDKLKESENNFRQINETIDEVFWLYDAEQSKMSYISPSCKKILGCEQQYFYADSNYWLHYVVETHKGMIHLAHKQIEQEGFYEIAYQIRRDGELRWIFEKAFGIKNDEGKTVKISGICSDVTKEKESQAKIKQLSLVAEKATNGILISDEKGFTIWANQAFLEMFEISLEKLVNQRPSILFGKEGDISLVEIDAKNKTNFIMELEALTYKNNIKWVELNHTAIKDDNGNLIQQVEILTDITERKKSENELLEKQEQLQQLLDVTSNQNQRLQNFAHIVSHNIRSHSSNLTMLTTFLNEPEDDKEQQKFFQMLKLSTNKLAETVENLNEIITIQNNLNVPKTRLNIRDEIEKTMQALNTIILANEVEVINTVAENVNIKGLASYIESILLNMLTNAIKYRSPDRKAIIQFSAEKLGFFWVISIQDNGLGIDLAKHGHKLFGMYKTFHKNADARGIGLFITKNQIEAMGGKIEVESQIGIGSTFKIYLYAND